MSAPLPEDKRAGFTGLIVGAIILLVALYGIVHLTNRHYAKIEGAKTAAATTK